MVITPQLFAAHLKCPTKCWLRWTDEQPTGNTYAEWVADQNETYRDEGTKRLMADVPADECSAAPVAGHLKTAKWRLASDVPVQASDLETRIHAVERVPSAGPGHAAQFIPVRFIFFNKLGRHDKLLLAFDALTLSESLKRDISAGKIIHGDNYATLKVKTSALAGEVKKQVAKIAALLASSSPPDLVLNRHCAECEFQARCRKIAVEKDDLSLLAGMSAKERQKLRSKGIFTVTQLSYTFRPRRRPKRQRDKREKYHHALKALAIREKKIHIVGSPELKIAGTPVYLDVEGLPDRDFYYLIGLRIGNGESTVQYSLWANTIEDEEKIWREFLGILETVEKPVLIHYGSYETVSLRRMFERYGCPLEGTAAATAIGAACNILSAIFARVYFPVFSNGLKAVAGWLNFTWPEALKGGLETIASRECWVERPSAEAKQQLILYNTRDCAALDLVTTTLLDLQLSRSRAEAAMGQQAVDVTSLKRESPHGFKRNTWVIPELDTINKAAYWDYQRERVYVRSSRQIRRDFRHAANPNQKIRPNQIVQVARPRRCPRCNSPAVDKHVKGEKIVRDLKFTPAGVKRWIVRYDFHRYICRECGRTFYPLERECSRRKYGVSLMAYSVYQNIDLRMPGITVDRILNKLFGLQLAVGSTDRFRARAAGEYAGTYKTLLEKLKTGNLIHADETKVSVDGRDAFVWVFASMEAVVYVFAETREADVVRTWLEGFKGVLVSDFFAAYEGIPCPQQKCLIHLIRDLNEALHSRPFDDELRRLTQGFTFLLKPIVETVDRFGLKKRFLRKHRAAVSRFYRELRSVKLESDAALKFKERFQKHRAHLFTFLEYDGVPWNNNIAEHAIKPLALLRHVINGVTSKNGIRDYLILRWTPSVGQWIG